MTKKETYICNHCGADADMTLEGFENVQDVIKRKKHYPVETAEKRFYGLIEKI